MQQSKTKPCPECGEERVWVNAKARERLLLEQPQRFVPFLSLEKKNWSYIRALTCTFCGYTVLYANDPNDLIPDR
ncbi:conserved hypothetical protein [Ktedonobacter racemifer DSM 44963]|uniref:Uncharacterized protein n=1 Tax=Ktedonobacter racemifer DSM 44963 TaxID=485913 RepID=D6THV9_KTERA|nr:conserved hypothetical protein [Ktedonobacter racemifer DSM 44963]